MLFCSTVFLFFFLSYLLIWRITSHSFKLWVIIAGGLIFYGYWNWNYLLIPIMLTLVGYIGGICISRSVNHIKRNLTLAIVVFITVLPLLIFKYLNFFAGREIITLGLPLGISFITFTLIAYLVDVYRRSYPAEPSLSWLMGYIVFFPQLIAGPILRPAELLPQLKKTVSASWHARYQALCIFTVGMVKKLCFADQIDSYVAHAFQVGGKGYEGLIALYTFPVQLYCDFSGYSDMAIGLALFFGINLPINFDRPYLATSCTDIWRRWHITLSFWFRDYVYFPLLGRGSSSIHKVLCKLFTMILCGFWHGAGWTFLAWGFLHGIFLSIEHFLNKSKIPFNPPKPLKIIFTFHLWAVATVIFAAPDLSNALEILGNVFSGSGYKSSTLSGLVYPITLTLIFYIVHPFDSIHLIKKAADNLNPWFMITMISLIWLIAITLSSSSGGSAKFIYFDF